MNIEEFISGLILIPYLFIYPIGYIVFINGILCHWSCAFDCSLKTQKFCQYLDIITNILLALYVNYYTTWQPWTIIITSLVVIFWLFNRNRPNYSVTQHTLFVQLPLFICLMKYQLCCHN